MRGSFGAGGARAARPRPAEREGRPRAWRQRSSRRAASRRPLAFPAGPGPGWRAGRSEWPSPAPSHGPSRRSFRFATRTSAPPPTDRSRRAIRRDRPSSGPWDRGEPASGVGRSLETDRVRAGARSPCESRPRLDSQSAPGRSGSRATREVSLARAGLAQRTTARARAAEHARNRSGVASTMLRGYDDPTRNIHRHGSGARKATRPLIFRDKNDRAATNSLPRGRR